MSAARATAKKTKKKATAAKKASKTRRTRAGSKRVAAAKAKSASARVEAPPPSANEPELVLDWFRLLARCRGAWLQQLWTINGSIDGRATITHAELAGILADHDSPEAEENWAGNQELIRQWKAAAKQIEETLNSLADSRFNRLAHVFGLSAEEVQLLRLCAAVNFDPSLARVCAYLQDHSGRTYMTEELATRMLGLGRAGVWAPEMNVFRWDLIEQRETAVAEPPALICDSQISDWLSDRSTLDPVLTEAATVIEPNGGLAEWPVAELAGWIADSLKRAERLRVIVMAPAGGGKREFAAAVARTLEMPLVTIDSDAADDANWSRLFVHAQRQAFLDSAVPAWTGEAAVRRQWPASPLFPIQFILSESASLPNSIRGAVDRVVRLPMPEVKTREKLWRSSAASARDWKADEVRKLAEHHNVWPGDITHAGRLGPETPADAALLVREKARSRFGELAQILECPFTTDDLVLPEGVKQTLEAISFEAEERGAFWNQTEPRRLFPQGRGLIALFSGPSGTGKTMAAQVIAARLTQDLCRVNVAQLVSKWVGETSKNVEQVVRVAAENNVVLFFDEADAFFARRSLEIRDAQDKFANTDTAYLLQAIESYPGIAVLATNLKSNIDPAFLRRLRYLVEFPKPNARLQLTLWTKLVTALAGKRRAEVLAPAFELLSASIDATGAQIKFAVLAALFAARADDRPLNAKHLLVGMDRELAKEGRAIGPRERDRILKLEEAA